MDAPKHDERVSAVEAKVALLEQDVKDLKMVVATVYTALKNQVVIKSGG